MKIQLAYRFTGEDREKVIEILKKIVDILENKDHDVYCSALDSNIVNTEKEIFENAFKKLNDADVLLILMISEDKSEGMLMEAGYATAKGKKIILAIKKDVQNTHLRELIDDILE